MAEPPHLVTQARLADVVFEWEFKDIVQIIENPLSQEDMHAVFFCVQKNVTEYPLQQVAQFLGVPFSPSQNMISGEGGVVPDAISLTQVSLLSVFESECLFNGRSFLPSPLNDAAVTKFSMATYAWQGFLRIAGQNCDMIWDGDAAWQACR